MNRTLIVYPNCSKGGVTSVLRGRALAEPDREFDFVFINDRGGRPAFAELDNVNVRIIRKDRLPAFLDFVASTRDYDSIHILSMPEAAAKISVPETSTLIYEFHSSDMTVIGNEVDKLDFAKIHEIVVPSQWLAERISSVLPHHFTNVHVEPNLVDHSSFHLDQSSDRNRLPNDRRPLLWVGRFDTGKGYKHFLRALAQLPEEYEGYLITSLETDPARTIECLGEAAQMRVDHRIHLLLNVDQATLGEIYREAGVKGGWFISTSLMESFGYGVLEAVECGLRVCAFDLPALREHGRDDLMHFVDIGDVEELARTIHEQTRATK